MRKWTPEEDTIAWMNEKFQIMDPSGSNSHEIKNIKPSNMAQMGIGIMKNKELFQLQQILFFKGLSVSLKQISKVIGRSDFDQLAALHSHKP